MNHEGEKFDPVDAELLLYLADEIPATTRAATERRLATEPELRRRLDELRAAHESTSRALHEMDQAQAFHGSTTQVERTIRQWTTTRQVQAARTPAGHRQARWIWPSVAAVAAVIVMGFWIWKSIPTPTNVAIQPDVGPGTEVVVAEPMRNDDLLGYRSARLDEAESELDALAYLQQSLVQRED